MGSSKWNLASSDFFSSLRHGVTGAVGGAILGVCHAYQAANGALTQEALVSAAIGGVVAFVTRLLERGASDTTNNG